MYELPAELGLGARTRTHWAAHHCVPELSVSPLLRCVWESGSRAAAVSPWLPGNPGLALGVSGQGLIPHHHLTCLYWCGRVVQETQ